MSTSRLLTSRRTTVGLVLAGPLALSACELDPPTRSRAETSSPAPGPDAEVVASARTAILAMAATVEAAIAAHRRLGPGLRPWVTLHAAHLEVLDDGSAEESGEAQPVGGTATAASEQIAAQEAQLARTLAAASQQSASGDLARVLASMSAALKQRVIG